MPIEVELPDGGIAEFPDTMGMDEITSIINKHTGFTPPDIGAGPPNVSGLDVARQQPSLAAPPVSMSDIIARSNEPWQPTLRPLSQQDIDRIQLAGQAYQERRESQRREEGLTPIDRLKLYSGKTANVAADVLSGAARFLKAPPNLFGGTFKTLTGQEPPAPSPILPESITGPMENLAGQVKRNVAGELERLPQTTGRFVEENVADIGAGLIPAVVPLGPLFMALQEAGAPDLESEAKDLSEKNGIPIEQARQQVLNNAVNSGVITGATWATLPKPFQEAGQFALSKIPAKAAQFVGRPGMLAARQVALSGVPLTVTSIAEQLANKKPVQLSELPARFGVSSLFPAGGKERLRESAERAMPELSRRVSQIEAREKIAPEDPKLLEEKSKIVQEAIDTAEKANPEVPIRGAKGTEVLTHEGVPIWVNETGVVSISSEGFP